MLLPRPELTAYRRERHPKAYVTWLCRDPLDKRGSTYRESESGTAALKALDWTRVLDTAGHCTYARAFMRDLAAILGPPATALPEGDEPPLLARGATLPESVLRNL